MRTLAILSLSALAAAGCASGDRPPPPPKQPVARGFTFTGQVVEKAGRCHTIASRQGRYAVDRGVLRGIPVRAWVRVRAVSARRQICPRAQRVIVTSLRWIRQRDLARTYRNPRSRGLPLDHCRRYRRQCGRAAALAFCRSHGFRRVAAFSTRPARRTRVMGSGRVCRSQGRRVCRRFSVIRCNR